MKRYLNWVLGGLAVLTAIAALRPRSQPVTPVAKSDPEPEVDRRPRWFDEPLSVAKAVVLRLREHHMPIIAGSLSYYAFLAIFPAAIAAVSIYGLVLDPADLAEQITSISDALPKVSADFISQQLTSVVESSGSGLGVTAVVSIIAALWSASAGTKALITGIDIAYETPENRSFIVLRGMSFGITIGLIVFVGAAASAVTFLPDLLDAVGAEGMTQFVEYGRWPAIFILVIAGLGLLYKIAPNRPASKSPWISMGALVVAVLWLLATVGFSVYANNARSLGVTYGTLSGIIVLLLWFFISGLIVLLGAELNAELEARNLAHRSVRAGRP
ncbi:MAG: YihY/virulence factor BrkB family protein [bacterium]|nr:YihY/virulence factor BrkB family protein [bacterium]MCP4968061.1 YihY/virulence factor BrkB family protein [bacterium]